MPKVSRVGKFRAAAKASKSTSPLTSSRNNSASKDAAAVDTPLNDGKESLSRGQRKRLAKREQYLKREKMVMSSLRLRRLEEQKGKLDGLDSIRDALPSSNPKRLPGNSSTDSMHNSSVDLPQAPPCKTNRSKEVLANVEISHMGLVLDHPSFKENPFAAIQQHLRNSLASHREKLEQESTKRTQEENSEEAKKKEEKKDRIRDAKFSRKRNNKKFHSNRAKR
mmetsp:Transcript_17034/g.35763  ORF Transcript_17034/g.35763 Transcript_17034/m.35763 type:complete len:223 (+) Transcript_17034:177-845(+)|eukprot:CAMPEP_0171346126 /NCGR_PEP_ID=MMETSP0878-20121228/23588_1 /TAXON_ID=67004 /ORGANISM="Thalassiosira weissflogii, Strain CCMP1336" /LENGTH=222 /DNA_ID=CAMNT_0011849727 /DNA_START=51 /DNA_END=719 /DNA_ORIENTATION=-